jgi:hypothetical protein
MEHPKTVGERSELAVMYGLVCAGYQVLLPYGENTRYDMVIAEGERFSRVQCKTGRLRNGVIVFYTVSSYGHHPNPKIRSRNYLGEIDYFGVYCPETGGVYLVPIADAPNRGSASLRVEPTRNKQTRRVRYASNFEIKRLEPTG